MHLHFYGTMIALLLYFVEVTSDHWSKPSICPSNSPPHVNSHIPVFRMNLTACRRNRRTQDLTAHDRSSQWSVISTAPSSLSYIIPSNNSFTYIIILGWALDISAGAWCISSQSIPPSDSAQLALIRHIQWVSTSPLFVFICMRTLLAEFCGLLLIKADCVLFVLFSCLGKRLRTRFAHRHINMTCLYFVYSIVLMYFMFIMYG
jgi:hypothetical protein